jgi:hypothetical protein
MSMWPKEHSHLNYYFTNETKSVKSVPVYYMYMCVCVCVILPKLRMWQVLPLVAEHELANELIKLFVCK